MQLNWRRMDDRALSMADYDSFDLGWRSIELQHRMQAREELAQICRYACIRKETSRAGTVLILRFFHDYYPSEIARVLLSSRHSVDEWQRVARREVKLFLEDPSQLSFVTKCRLEPPDTQLPGANDDLIAELRRAIFRSRQGRCLTNELIQAIYRSDQAELLTTVHLAHIVSCLRCLNEVNRLLALPLVPERYEGSGGTRPPHEGNGTGATDLPTVCRRRLREVAEHRPQELAIAVNGSVVGALKVTSGVSELGLNFQADQVIEFVEVFSEQGIQLLFFSADQAGSRGHGQTMLIELSDRRMLEACLCVNNRGPILHIIYYDPVLVPAERPVSLQLVRDAAPSSATYDPASICQKSQNWTELLRSLNSRLFNSLKLWTRVTLLKAVLFRRVNQGPVTEQSTETDRVCPKDLRPASDLLASVMTHRTKAPVWARPGFVVAVLVGVLMTMLFVLRTPEALTITAASLLSRATAVEEIMGRRADQVTHRTINLEERRSPEGAVISRRRIEVWQSGEGQRARRLYNENNQLIAGKWERPGVSRALDHHGTHPGRHSPPNTPNELLLDEVWQVEPSAQQFAENLAHPEEAKAEARQSVYVISYEGEYSSGTSRVLKATLTLNRVDLHAVELTLVVQRGDEVREYRSVEVGFERRPINSVPPSVFEPDHELVGDMREKEQRGDTDNIHVPLRLRSAASVANGTAELEVEVAYLLNQARALGEQVILTRVANGPLQVEGFVESEQRKKEILRALAPVINNPAVNVNISSVVAAQSNRQRQSASLVRGVEAAPDSLPIAGELRAYFSRRQSPVERVPPSQPRVESRDEQIDREVREFSRRIVSQANRTLFHAIELQRLVKRFSAAELRILTPESRAKWLEMVHGHARVFARETAALRKEIQPIIAPDLALSSFDSDGPAILSEEQLADAVARLHQLALTNNEAVRSGFALSSKSSSAALKSSQFWVSFSALEQLSQRINQYR